MAWKTIQEKPSFIIVATGHIIKHEHCTLLMLLLLLLRPCVVVVVVVVVEVVGLMSMIGEINGIINTKTKVDKRWSISLDCR